MSSDPVGPVFGACPVPFTDRDRVLLGHGGGGALSEELLRTIFLPAFSNPILDRRDDQAVLELGGAERLAFTTDAYVVTPIFFPGGDIGRLAVNGTVNDLAVAGATPRWLSASFILEEGLALADLARVVESMRDAARAAGVTIVTGDTKVVGKGSGDQVFVTTSGLGVVPPGVEISPTRARPGDAVLVSGTLGDHGMTILACRQELGLAGDLASDTAPLHELVAAMRASGGDVHTLRDPTRGGLAATLNELAAAGRVGVVIDEEEVPVRDPVRGACELLGVDPLALANEGKLVAFVHAADAERILGAMRAHPLGRRARRIGTLVTDHPGQVVVRTGIGGERVLELPAGELLPRIC